MDNIASVSVRSLVGLPLAYIGGFIGMITGSLLVPSISDGDLLPLLTRIALIAAGTTVGALALWATFLLEWPKRALLGGVIYAGAFGCGLIAFYWSDAFTGNSDLYIRVREITQSTIVGATIGTTVIALVANIMTPRQWRS